MKTKWQLVLFVGLILLLASSVVGCGESYTQEDLDAAYIEGRNAGLIEGHRAGYNEGYDIAYTEGFMVAQEATQLRYDAGYEKGRQEGYDSGYQVGYEDGESALPEPDMPPVITQPEEEQVIKDLAYIKIFASGYTDDADPEYDGISARIIFYDSKSERITFENIPLTVTIELYGYYDGWKGDDAFFKGVGRKLIYEEQFTVDHSELLLGAEIRIPFEAIEPGYSEKTGGLKGTVTTPSKVASRIIENTWYLCILNR